VLLKNNRPLFAVDSKAGADDVSKHINYFSRRTEIPIFYQVPLGARDYEVSDCRTRVMPFTTFTAEILKV